MNCQMQMRKDEFRTDDEKDAWQKGYNSLEVRRGPPTPVGRHLEDLGAENGLRSVAIHPLSPEVLADMLQDLPENLHGALCAGWWCAFEDAVKRRR
jgi:hypothetical protein